MPNSQRVKSLVHALYMRVYREPIDVITILSCVIIIIRCTYACFYYITPAMVLDFHGNNMSCDKTLLINVIAASEK